MPEDTKTDEVEKLLSEEKAMEDRKQALIQELLRRRETAIKDFDEKLAKLGYHADSAKSRRSHHKKPATPPAETQAKPRTKT